MDSQLVAPLSTPVTAPSPRKLPKAPTGIAGFDEITAGGLPRGRPTLVCGAAGCGKTLLAMEFLVRGCVAFDEPGVFLSFEEAEADLAANVASLGFDIPMLQRQGKLAIDHVLIDRSTFTEAGDYDLEGLFVRLDHAVSSVGAKRLVIDTPEALFACFRADLLRAELLRLFRWIKDRGLTAVVTAERGQQSLTRYGLEEYVSDCVILLEHRLVERVSTRRLRILKYRGSAHGTDEYPFLIDEFGFSVLPVTALSMSAPTSRERVSTGSADLDEMLGGEGFFRGSSVLVSGGAGTGKTTLAAHFAHVACARGERCLYYAFEESPQQIVRNIRSIGIDLQPWIDAGLLLFDVTRPTMHGLEAHVARAQRRMLDFEPHVVIIDPMSAFGHAGPKNDARASVIRLADHLKARGITALFTALCSQGDEQDDPEFGTSSVMDTWITLRAVEQAGQRKRQLYVLKSRGMAHSHAVRTFEIHDQGLRLDEPAEPDEWVAPTAMGVVPRPKRQAELQYRQQRLERRQRQIEASVAALRAEYEAERLAIEQLREKIGDDPPAHQDRPDD